MLKKKIIPSGVRLSLQNQGQALEKIPRSSRFCQSPTLSTTLRVMSTQDWWVDFGLASPCWQSDAEEVAAGVGFSGLALCPAMSLPISLYAKS